MTGDGEECCRNFGVKGGKETGGADGFDDNPTDNGDGVSVYAF